MHYIDEMYPWTVVDQRKYMQYVKLRKERDKFLKSLKPGWYGEWTIHKKLIDAGGLGDTVYILPARGSGTSFRTLKKINDLLEEGRDVQPVTLKKYEWPMLSEKDIEKIRESVLEFQLYSELAKPYQDPVYYDLLKDFDPPGGWTLDPSWTIDPYGHVRFREISLVRMDDMPKEYSDSDYYWEKAEFQDPWSHRQHVENYKKGVRDSVAFDEQYMREAEEEKKLKGE